MHAVTSGVRVGEVPTIRPRHYAAQKNVNVLNRAVAATMSSWPSAGL
jgi:hypothetical protein